MNPAELAPVATDVSLIALFWQAHWIVKAVMLGLLACSVWVWAIAIDKIFLYYAPKILGGTGAVPFASGPGFRAISDAAYVKSFRLHRFGEDFAIEGYLKDPYQA